jgi:hypothetical protein
MPAKNQKKRRTRVTLTRTSEVLDVRVAAKLLTVSPDGADQIAVKICSEDGASAIGHLSPSARAFGFG